MNKPTASPATRTVRAAVQSDTQHGAIMPPLYLSTNFAFDHPGDSPQYDYTRSGNPTRDALGDAIAELEGGDGAVITSSGMSAIALVCQTLKPGDLLLASHDCYGGSFRLFDAMARKGSFDVRFIDLTDINTVKRALTDKPRMVWLETPSNPLLRITDIEAVARLCRIHDVLLTVDNTFLSPVLQKPLALGADIVVHSTTKYLNGHSDIVGGAVIAGNPELMQQLQYWGNCLGLTGAPFDSYLALRGLRTLHVRMSQHEDNARALADTLVLHPAVSKVHYPGLTSHPGHQTACCQQTGFGGMISFEIAGNRDDVDTLVTALECFSLAESLGGVESLIAHPASMSHASMTVEARSAAGIRDNLIRISVGIEATEDLIRDLVQALDRIATSPALAMGQVREKLTAHPGLANPDLLAARAPMHEN